MTNPILEDSAQDAGATKQTANGLKDQILSASRDLKDKAADVAGASAEVVKDHTSDFVETAKDVASDASDKLKQVVEDQRGVGAEYVGGLADTIRRAAREFEADLPIAATYMRKAASQFDDVSDKINEGNLSDIVDNVQSFARRQPTAFLGIAMLAGFGVVRFLKSSSGEFENVSRRREI
jgi:ElaB/YqjD/DUF883 family membrane-anchored ribosome-binding protein